MAKISTYPIVTPEGDDLIIGTVALDGTTKNFKIDDIDKNYRHVQMVPATIWDITHNLNKYPSVQVVDTSKRVIVGELDYLDLNTVRITLSSAIGGEAYFN